QRFREAGVWVRCRRALRAFLPHGSGRLQQSRHRLGTYALLRANLAFRSITCEKGRRSAIVNMRQRGPKIARQWILFFGWMIVLHVALFLSFAALEQHIRRNTTLVLVLIVPFLIALFILMVSFFRRLGDAAAPPEYREAKANGLPAKAKVL